VIGGKHVLCPNMSCLLSAMMRGRYSDTRVNGKQQEGHLAVAVFSAHIQCAVPVMLACKPVD